MRSGRSMLIRAATRPCENTMLFNVSNKQLSQRKVTEISKRRLVPDFTSDECLAAVFLTCRFPAAQQIFLIRILHRTVF